MAMARTRRSVGSVRRKANGRWYAELTVPSDEGSGSRRVALGGHPTKVQAERAVAQAVVALEKGELVRADRQALGRYLVEVWLPSIEGEIRPTSFANYRALANCYVFPHSIAKKRLDALHELDFKQLYATLRREGGRAGAGLSPKTILHVHVMLRRALEDATASRLVVRTPRPASGPASRRRNSPGSDPSSWMLFSPSLASVILISTQPSVLQPSPGFGVPRSLAFAGATSTFLPRRCRSLEREPLPASMVRIR